MATVSGIIARIRSEVGDFGSPFRDVFTGGGELSSYDLSETFVGGVSATVTSGSPPVNRALVAPADYVLDVPEGRIVLMGSNGPLRHGETLTVVGRGSGMFGDDQLGVYVQDALNQHAYGRSIKTRFRDQMGFIRYDEQPVVLGNLPAVEEPLLAYLASINVLWTLATDAASDIDISTSEGTFFPRTQRYAQLMAHIGDATSGLQGRYNTLAAMLNIGLGRIEMFTLRRVSRTTGRLVPVFEPREYDDTTLPTRLIPPIDGQYEDDSGVPSPLFPGVWG